ncbi:hypothetical protein MD588_14435, partial [Photobacterium sp. SDRW27]|uniref:hypothetical protein n=1 Tax=Photobacterium obscurum TaxID=2829490 RepID=UPI002243072A
VSIALSNYYFSSSTVSVFLKRPTPSAIESKLYINTMSCLRPDGTNVLLNLFSPLYNPRQ